MTTLVTGATGFVGSHVARQLASAGRPVRILVRQTSDLRALDGLAAERVIGDLCDPASLNRATEGVHRVFHVAADYRLWARNPEEIYRSNVEGTRLLLEAAKRAGVERVVYTSTVATVALPTHDGSLPNEQTRATIDQMIGHYKRSKLLAEQEAIKAASDGVPVVILDFLKGKMPAYVDTGLNVVAVEDVAAGHLLAAEKGRIGERYILGGRNMTLKQILDALAITTGRPAPRIKMPHAVALAAAYSDQWLSRLVGREPQIPVEGVKMSRHRMFVESDKAERELGYHPGSPEAALERAVRWYEEHGYVRSRDARKNVVHATAA
jgi:dihydroflavonol-4-reductase